MSKEEEPKEEVSKLTEIRRDEFLVGLYHLHDYWCGIREQSQDLFYQSNKVIVSLAESIIKSQELENMGLKVDYFRDQEGNFFYQYRSEDRTMGFEGMIPSKSKIPEEKPPFELSAFTDPTAI